MAEDKKKIQKVENQAESKTPAKVVSASKKSDIKSVVKADKKPVAKKTTKTETILISEIKATARYIKVSPRKVRLVVDQIRGLQADEASDRLRFIKKEAVQPITKLLNSALANAQNNFEINKTDLFVKTITVDQGPTLKRFRPRAHGRSAMIRKRTSNINLILGVKDGAVKKVEKKSAAKDEVKIVSPDEVKKDRGHSHGGSDDGGLEIGKSGKGFMKGVFQRKTG